jgi:hypothetical protein
MFTCCIRYVVSLEKMSDFLSYARSWIALIEKYGGTHHGYFLPQGPTDEKPDATFSFPGLGKEGPPNIAVALFSFPNVEAYESYRRRVAEDEECKRATAQFNESRCFSSYERTFLTPILPLR